MTQSPENIRHFEQKLIQLQADLRYSMLSAVEQGRQTSTDDTQDVADQAVASYQKELLFSQGTTGHTQLTLIRAALLTASTARRRSRTASSRIPCAPLSVHRRPNRLVSCY